MRILGLLWLGSILPALIASTVAAEMQVKVEDKEPPKEVGEDVRKELQLKAIELLAGGNASYQFWFRKEIPLKAKPESDSKSLQAVDEVTLLGVAVVGVGHRDYKDNEIAPGTYTVRFGLQPQDGDHLGTSEYPYFAVLIPAKADPELNGIKTYKAMVKASGKSTATGHPVVLSLRPATEGGALPKLTEPAAEHKAVRLSVPGKQAGSTTTGLVFELVYEGKFKS
jgi:hypothetical protein